MRSVLEIERLLILRKVMQHPFSGRRHVGQVTVRAAKSLSLRVQRLEPVLQSLIPNPSPNARRDARRNSRNCRLLSNRSGSRAISSGVYQWTDSTSWGLGVSGARRRHLGQPPCQLDLPRRYALPHPPHWPDRHAKLLAKLPHKGLLFRFAVFDASAGKAIDQRRHDRPGAANHQHPAVAQHDADGAPPARIVGDGCRHGWGGS